MNSAPFKYYVTEWSPALGDLDKQKARLAKEQVRCDTLLTLANAFECPREMQEGIATLLVVTEILIDYRALWETGESRETRRVKSELPPPPPHHHPSPSATAFPPSCCRPLPSSPPTSHNHPSPPPRNPDRDNRRLMEQARETSWADLNPDGLLEMAATITTKAGQIPPVTQPSDAGIGLVVYAHRFSVVCPLIASFRSD